MTTRKRWGRCKHCSALTWHRCHRCKGWLCVHEGAPCGRLRKVPNQVGRYDLVCGATQADCRKTRSDFGRPKANRAARGIDQDHTHPGAV